ncbi:11222_t:CDS:2, partial [Racocetra persica]
ENLTCLFNKLVESYKYTKQLAEYETKETQRIRNTSTELIKNRIQLFEPFFSELSDLKNELQKYIICEKYYNQIIAKDNYLDFLNSKISDYPRKRSRNSNNNSTILSNTLEPSTVDIRIQVTIDSDLTQINTLKAFLANLVTDHSKQLQLSNWLRTLKSDNLIINQNCQILSSAGSNLDIDNESLGQHARPDSYVEQQRFHTDINLSEEIKSFSALVQEKRQMFIRNTLLQPTEIRDLNSAEETIDEENIINEHINEN